ncbi:hypothetical protein OG407_00555 [Streptomyces sp. NBC_01515]|uniref:hypothetical protein n=1 Tax=Streptomyces sp. NBC_01515 TaxID=2903890 RepID=UPI00386C86FC
MDGGQLFVLGRVDDELVHHGRNFYAVDTLTVCVGTPDLRPGRCAVFTTGDGGPGERLCLVVEASDGPDASPPADVAAQVRRRLAHTLGLYVSEMVLLPNGRLPVTPSGKVRVFETRRRVEQGALPALRPRAFRRTPSKHAKEDPK